ncbi:hypothetical protein CRM94_24705 [Burkholderia gladioli]|uniref:Chitin-binding type-1 domain-containing protein n=1 Tax=Burkholderia gladioli TaxID=28095 RepID=A0A2A7S2A0_BURGA|nr:hypothetical protein CEJ98_14490 [Burkholderia gladioli pv. gladioli]AWY54687.1 hypothetical protein A8H28_26640 [Burkholderia gladioli pv. gladioli]PEH37701.1 hypothetical protein CRM94_24705 [Burkholderia gladioli]
MNDFMNKMMKFFRVVTNFVILFSIGFLPIAGYAQQCGIQANYAACPNQLCCSEYGFCGSTDEYCGDGCQTDVGYCSPSTGTPGEGLVCGLATLTVTSAICGTIAVAVACAAGTVFTEGASVWLCSTAFNQACTYGGGVATTVAGYICS